MGQKIWRLDCRGCIKLVKVCPSIGCLQKLHSLELARCIKISSLPSIKHLTSFENLDLSDCSKIREFPEIPDSIKYLCLMGTAIQEIPSSICFFSRLKILSLLDCENLKNLPIAFFQLGYIEKLSICGP